MSSLLSSLNLGWSWLVVFFSVLAWSAFQPRDALTWALEVSPAVIGLLLLWLTRHSFPLTPLLYFLILLHCLILMVGGHYTYAEVPLFDDIARWTGSERNNYDKLGHFAQGFVPVLICREIVVRLRLVRRGFWTNFFAVCFALAFSAFYELIEWWVALIVGGPAEKFLATQGYVWDTQSDMFLALLGALLAVLLLSGTQDRQIRRLEEANV